MGRNHQMKTLTVTILSLFLNAAAALATVTGHVNPFVGSSNYGTIQHHTQPLTYALQGYLL